MFGALGVLDEDVEDGLEDSDRVINTEVGAFTGRLLANQYMNKPLDEVHLMARFVRQWLELPRERSGERRVVDLQQAFADATGVALDDLLVVTAALWARSLMNNVSSRTALLVTDGSFDGGKADDAGHPGYPRRAPRRVRSPPGPPAARGQQVRRGRPAAAAGCCLSCCCCVVHRRRRRGAHPPGGTRRPVSGGRWPGRAPTATRWGSVGGCPSR